MHDGDEVSYTAFPTHAPSNHWLYTRCLSLPMTLKTLLGVSLWNSVNLIKADTKQNTAKTTNSEEHTTVD